MSRVWIFKTNYADPTFRIEFASQSGMMPANFSFNDIHELRQFLERRLPATISTQEILQRLALAGHVEVDVSETVYT